MSKANTRQTMRYRVAALHFNPHFREELAHLQRTLALSDEDDLADAADYFLTMEQAWPPPPEQQIPSRFVAIWYAAMRLVKKFGLPDALTFLVACKIAPPSGFAVFPVDILDREYPSMTVQLLPAHVELRTLSNEPVVKVTVNIGVYHTRQQWEEVWKALVAPALRQLQQRLGIPPPRGRGAAGQELLDQVRRDKEWYDLWREYHSNAESIPDDRLQDYSRETIVKGAKRFARAIRPRGP